MYCNWKFYFSNFMPKLVFSYFISYISEVLDFSQFTVFRLLFDLISQNSKCIYHKKVFFFLRIALWKCLDFSQDTFNACSCKFIRKKLNLKYFWERSRQNHEINTYSCFFLLKLVLGLKPLRGKICQYSKTKNKIAYISHSPSCLSNPACFSFFRETQAGEDFQGIMTQPCESPSTFWYMEMTWTFN